MYPSHRTKSGVGLRRNLEADWQIQEKKKKAKLGLNRQCLSRCPSSALATVWSCGSVHLLSSSHDRGSLTCPMDLFSQVS